MPKSRRLLFQGRFVDLHRNPARISLLNSPECTIKPFITALTVGHIPGEPTHPGVTLDEFVWTVINQCTSLTSLQVRPSGKTILPFFLGLSSSLTHLRIIRYLRGSDDWASITAGRLLELIGNFDALEILSLTCPAGTRRLTVDPISVPANSKQPLSGLTRLRRLEVDLEWNVFIPWFLIPGVSPFPDLETLELKFNQHYFSVRAPLLQPFFNLCSFAVKHLTISVRWRVLPVLDLSHFVCLRSICFTGLGAGPDPHHLQQLIDIVSTCPNRNTASPLRVYLTTYKELQGPSAIQGVEWIVKER
ncbi:hypothetical protein AAF712_005229 [Marasmius tenuissimus]|uniref:Uncharacterized protein n=1 Tax=Marasmius tenuissimus TaxID=585030 RepID=A0ABR3A360_9AGAR